MSAIEMSIEGDRAAEIVVWLETRLREEFGVRPKRRVIPVVLPESQAGRRGIDALALASFILTIPSAILAAVELAERLDRRRRLRALLAALEEASAKSEVVVTIRTSEGFRHLRLMRDGDLDALGEGPWTEH